MNIFKAPNIQEKHTEPSFRELLIDWTSVVLDKDSNFWTLTGGSIGTLILLQFLIPPWIVVWFSISIFAMFQVWSMEKLENQEMRLSKKNLQKILILSLFWTIFPGILFVFSVGTVFLFLDAQEDILSMIVLLVAISIFVAVGLFASWSVSLISKHRHNFRDQILHSWREYRFLKLLAVSSAVAVLSPLTWINLFFVPEKYWDHSDTTEMIIYGLIYFGHNLPYLLCFAWGSAKIAHTVYFVPESSNVKPT